MVAAGVHGLDGALGTARGAGQGGQARVGEGGWQSLKVVVAARAALAIMTFYVGLGSRSRLESILSSDPGSCT